MTLKITCNACENDLTYTANYLDYRIRVTCEKMPTKALVNDVMFPAPFDVDLHFCSKGCLQKYMIHGG